MRFAFWRKGEGEIPVRNAAPVLKSAPPRDVPSPEVGDLDLRVIWQTLKRKKRWVIIPTLCAFGLALAAVNLVTPRYKSEARILIDGRENVFLRPNGERNEERSALDPEVVAQLLARSRHPLGDLTPREREVLALMAEGRSNAAIAATLVVGAGAVEKHINNIFTKLGLAPAERDHRRVLAVLRYLGTS